MSHCSDREPESAPDLLGARCARYGFSTVNFGWASDSSASRMYIMGGYSFGQNGNTGSHTSNQVSDATRGRSSRDGRCRSCARSHSAVASAVLALLCSWVYDATLNAWAWLSGLLTPLCVGLSGTNWEETPLEHNRRAAVRNAVHRTLRSRLFLFLLRLCFLNIAGAQTVVAHVPSNFGALRVPSSSNVWSSHQNGVAAMDTAGGDIYQLVEQWLSQAHVESDTHLRSGSFR